MEGIPPPEISADNVIGMYIPANTTAHAPTAHVTPKDPKVLLSIQTVFQQRPCFTSIMFEQQSCLDSKTLEKQVLLRSKNVCSNSCWVIRPSCRCT